MIPLNWKLILPSNHFDLLIPLSKQDKKEFTVLAGVLDPEYQGEFRLLLHSRGKGQYIWSARDPVEHFLLLPCPVIKANRNHSSLIQAGWQTSQNLQEWRYGSSHQERTKTWWCARWRPRECRMGSSWRYLNITYYPTSPTEMRIIIVKVLS